MKVLCMKGLAIHHILRVMGFCGYIEKLGTGIVKIRSLLEKEDCLQARFEFTSFFTVTFPRRIEDKKERDVPVNVPVNKRQQWFLNQLGMGRRVKAADITARWNVVKKTAKRDIAELKKHGIIEFIGSPKTGFYQTKEK